MARYGLRERFAGRISTVLTRRLAPGQELVQLIECGRIARSQVLAVEVTLDGDIGQRYLNDNRLGAVFRDHGPVADHSDSHLEHFTPEEIWGMLNTYHCRGADEVADEDIE